MRAQLGRIIGLQVAISLVIALACLAFYGANAAVSAFLGGAIGFVGSFAYAWKIAGPQTRNTGGTSGTDAAADPKAMMRAHLVGEALKLALTVILFAAVLILYKGVATLPLLLTFIATLVVYWVALLFVF